MNFINCTPHNIALNDGRVFPTTGIVARVSSSFTDIVDDTCRVQYGSVQDIPAPQDGVRYIVSAMVLAASDRKDLVAPATSHPDCRRDQNGRIVSVPCFVTK